MKSHILIVDDEKLIRKTLEAQLCDEGYAVSAAENGFRALEILGRESIDVVITDLRMPSMDGLEFQRRLRAQWPETALIFMTAFGTVDSAVTAMREGAADYLSKPLNAEELLIRLERLVTRKGEIAEIKRLRSDAARQQQRLGDLLYRSPAMAAVAERLMAIVDTDVTVLVEGETGTGKELVARALHQSSPRAKGPFVVVNCTGLNPNLVESELFGHEAGAFTGATRQRKGRLESADAGTLLIDEVDDLSPEVQQRLLRFLNDRSFERVGGNRTMTSDVRVVCATKRSLTDLMREGRFREDLFYRINTVVIPLPPLRDRTEDILPLAEYFAGKFWKARGYSGDPEIGGEAIKILVSYDWPGNVRELLHAIEHAVAFCRGLPIEGRHLPASLSTVREDRRIELNLAGIEDLSFTEVMANCERQLFDWALARAGGNQVQAAELLHLPRTTFRSRLAGLRSEPPPPPDKDGE